MTQQHTFELVRYKTKKIITISENETYKDLDRKICEAYDYALNESERAFFIGKPWVGYQLATVNPDGSGKNIDEKLGPLLTKENVSYVFDFDQDIHHKIKFLQ